MDDFDMQLQISAECASRIVAALAQSRNSVSDIHAEEMYHRFFDLVFNSLEVEEN